MIRTSLSIDEIASRLGGDVVSSNTVRAPMRGEDAADRSLIVTKTPAGLIVLPKMRDGENMRDRPAALQAATAHVEARLSATNEGGRSDGV